MPKLEKESLRWHIVMTGLLFPAFLGALIYNIFELLLKLAESTLPCSCATLILIAAIFVLYIFDYVYTYVGKENYDGRNFLCDLTIVVFLYFSVKVALMSLGSFVEAETKVIQHTLSPLLMAPAIWLFLTKFASVIWEWFKGKKTTSEADKTKAEKVNKFDIETDLICGVLYLAIFLASTILHLLSPTFTALSLVVAVSFDIWWYYRDIVRRDSEQSQSA